MREHIMSIEAYVERYLKRLASYEPHFTQLILQKRGLSLCSRCNLCNKNEETGNVYFLIALDSNRLDYLQEKKMRKTKKAIRKTLLLQKSSVKGLKDVLKGNVQPYNAKYIGVCNH